MNGISVDTPMMPASEKIKTMHIITRFDNQNFFSFFSVALSIGDVNKNGDV